MDSLRKDLGPFVRLLRHHLRFMVLGTLLGMTAVCATIGLLSLAGWFLAAAAVAGATPAGGMAFNFFFPSVGVRIFAFARTLARYGERIVCHDATFRILKTLRVWCYRRIEPLAPAGLARHRRGDLLNRLVEDVDTLDNLYVRVLSPGAAALMVAVTVAVVLWRVEPAMALWVFGCLCMAGFGVSAGAGRLAMKSGRRLGQVRAALHARVLLGMQGLAELLVYGGDRAHLAAVAEESRSALAAQRHMSRIAGVSAALMTVISGFAFWAVLYIGVGSMEAGRIGGPQLAFAAMGAMAAFEAVWPLPAAFQFMGRTREAGRRLGEITRQQPVPVFPERSEATPQGFDLRFDAVTFAYPGTGKPVLEGVDFHIAAGTRTALLGETGSGKSTIVHLLARFWDPDAGAVRIGGRDIRTFSETDLRRLVTVVSQDAHIFNATLGDNLRMACPDADDARLTEAIEQAGLGDFLGRLPRGLDTWVGEAGARLSGGQARRLAVARAFLHDAPVWVLDEPTEGLDRATERRLMASILRHTRHRTLLLITHRLSDMDRMDTVLVLASGAVQIP